MTTPPQSSPSVRTVVSGMSYTECPRWHEDRLWFSDFYRRAVFSVREDGTDLRTEVEVPGQPSGLGWLPDGRLLFVSMKDRRLMRREDDGTVVVHADLSAHATHRLNDLVVDDRGRAYVGNFGFDIMAFAPMRTTDLLRVDPDGSVAVVAHDLHFPNGMVITDDNVLLVDETTANRISAFDIADDGSLGPRRDFAVFGPLSPTDDMTEAFAYAVLGPDGCGLDAAGHLWVADSFAQRVVRVSPKGAIVQEIDPGMPTYACMLGGRDGTTLFLSCAPDFLEEQRSPVREAEIRAVQVAVPHAGRP